MGTTGPHHAAAELQANAIKRRDFLKYLGLTFCAAATLPFFPRPLPAAPRMMLTRRIPRTDEYLPVIGMGTWRTFHVGSDIKLRNARTEVLRTFLQMGGGMVDSSPMYGSAEQVLGYGIKKIGKTPSLFSATKVWTPHDSQGMTQILNSHDYWGLDHFDLLQIHNLLGWEEHLETLIEWRNLGLTRYIGITTSHGRRHKLLEKVMTTVPIDFVQFSYNILDRKAEERLLPIARERQLGVIINRPFRTGELFPLFQNHPLPPFASRFGCTNWAQFLLKYVVSHPDVTCAIPATSRVDHMRENMGALEGRLPDQQERQWMERYIKSL